MWGPNRANETSGAGSLFNDSNGETFLDQKISRDQPRKTGADNFNGSHLLQWLNGSLPQRHRATEIDQGRVRGRLFVFLVLSASVSLWLYVHESLERLREDTRLRLLAA